MNESQLPKGRPDPDPGPSGPPTTSGKPACEKLGLGMTCQHCVDFLMDYVDGTLADEAKYIFESHLAYCPDCTTYMHNYRKAAALAAALGKSGRPAPDAEIPKSLVDAILKSRKNQR